MLHIVDERESAHAKLETRTTLWYLQCPSQTYIYIEKSAVQITRRAHYACQQCVRLVVFLPFLPTCTCTSNAGSVLCTGTVESLSNQDTLETEEVS